MAPPPTSPEDDKPRNPWSAGTGNGSPPKEPPSRGPWGNNKGNSGKNGKSDTSDLNDALQWLERGLRSLLPGGAHPARVIGLAIALLLFLWLASGLFVLIPGQQGVIQRFGAWTRTATAPGLGYHWPWPVEMVSKVNVAATRRMEIGFTSNPEGVSAHSETYHGDATVGGPQDLPNESLMLTSDTNIVDVDLVVFWNIKSAEAYEFNILDPDATIKKVAESAIREVVGQTAMFPILTTDRQAVADRTREIMERTLDSYKSGVNISQVLIQEAAVPSDVQDAFQDVQSSRQDAYKMENQAEAYAQDILPKARGQATKIQQDAEAYQTAEIARATGDAQRFDSVLQAYRLGPDVTKRRLYLETMESLFDQAQKTIVDGRGGNGVLPYLSLDNPKTISPQNSALGVTPAEKTP